MPSRGIDRTKIAPERVDAVKQNADASKYLRAHFLLSNIRKKYLLGRITFQEYRTIRGQAIGGDLDGAMKGLARIEARKAGEEIM